MVLIVTIGGKSDFIYTGVSIQKSASNLITTASISVPQNALAYVQSGAEVSIEYNHRILFHGMTTDWRLKFSAGLVSLDIPCVDYSYKLSHMAVSVSSAVTYVSGTVIGSILVSLLATTGIRTEKISQDPSVILTSDLVIPPGSMIWDVISKLCKDYQCLFYLDYARDINGIYTYAIFGKIAYVETLPAFLETHAITETNLVTMDLSLNSVSEISCTRVIAIKDNAMDYDIGVATYGSAPYIDKVVAVNVNDSTPVATLAQTYLDNFRLVNSKLGATFKSLSISLFNILDISGLSRLTGDIIELDTYRVTDISYKVSQSGVIVSVSGVDPTTSLWADEIKQASGDMSVGTLIKTEASYQAEEAKPVYAEVIA